MSSTEAVAKPTAAQRFAKMGASIGSNFKPGTFIYSALFGAALGVGVAGADYLLRNIKDALNTVSGSSCHYSEVIAGVDLARRGRYYSHRRGKRTGEHCIFFRQLGAQYGLIRPIRVNGRYLEKQAVFYQQLAEDQQMHRLASLAQE